MKPRILTLIVLLGATGCPSSTTLGPDSSTGPDGGEPPLDSGAPAACFEPGAVRTVACGNCGLASEECSAEGEWFPASGCLSEGPCAPGAVETESLAMCGERQRICDDACQWRDWTTTTEPGQCEPGATRVAVADTCPDGLQPQTCTAACRWEEAGACTDVCGGTARTTPEWASEICIPAGPFIRGNDSTDPFDDAAPAAEIVLSAYYIDAYPVTNRRYRECVDAGVCSRPGIDWSPEGASSYADPTRGDYPVQTIDWEMARTFCDWDGGRALPTDAQWGKAARGPAPRDQPYVWDGDTYRCDLVLGPDCPGAPTFTTLLAQDPYDGLPGSESYYGTFLQYGGVQEWVADWWADRWYANPESRLMDPTGPATGTHRVFRGVPRQDAHTTWLVSQRGAHPPEMATAQIGFRCARPAP